MYYLFFALLLIALLGCIFFHCHRKKIICKVSRMDCCAKCSLLDELVYPFGYCFHCDCGFFSSTVDAPQKAAGYTWLYDYMAPRFQMVFDALPVYFNYRGRTWLIEFWKGQYGINTGAEIGVYHTDTIIPRSEWDTTIFAAATEEESPEMSMELFYKGNPVAKMCGDWWWLTIFSVGQFSNPDDLSLEITIHFPDFEMRNAFIDALYADRYNMDSLRLCICYTDVSLTFPPICRKEHFFRKIFCCYVQWKNKLFCRLYRFVTRPFECTCDRVLLLYFYLPFAFRRLLTIKRFRKHRRKKKRSCL